MAPAFVVVPEIPVGAIAGDPLFAVPPEIPAGAITVDPLFAGSAEISAGAICLAAGSGGAVSGSASDSGLESDGAAIGRGAGEEAPASPGWMTCFPHCAQNFASGEIENPQLEQYISEDK